MMATPNLRRSAHRVALLRLLVWAVACGLLLSLAACISRPDNVIDEDRMTEVLIDVHKAEGLLDVQRNGRAKGSDGDEYQKEVIASVLARHGLTKADYDTSLIWYSQNLQRLIKVYQRVQDSLTVQLDYWQAIASDVREFAVSAPGDSVNLWTVAPYALMDGRDGRFFRVWQIESDSNYVAGDTVRWQMSTHGLASRLLVASLSLTVARGDSTWLRGCVDVVHTDSLCLLTAAADSGADIRHVALSVLVVPAVADDSARISTAPVLVDGLRLMRYHRRDIVP